MVLSVSRRTDIPNYYSEWFFNRLKEGFLYVRNPINRHQVSEISLSPDVVDCIVFWTKNPKPMMGKLDKLNDYKYYFQFTLTGYGADVEPGVPHKRDAMLPVFQGLSEKIGREKVIWRYDPVLFTKRYTPEYHVKAFGQIARALRGYTDKCVISFVDVYSKNRGSMAMLKLNELDVSQKMEFISRLSQIASENGMAVGCCAEDMDFAQCGVQHNSCIDKSLIEAIAGCRISAGKDKSQRGSCGCMESIDVGTYNICRNGCVYCYANYKQGIVMENSKRYDPRSPLLCDEVMEGDRVTQREVKSLKI